MRAASVCGLLLVASACGRKDTLAVDLGALEPSFGRAALRTIVLAIEHGGTVDVAVIDAGSGRGVEAMPAVGDLDGAGPVRLTAWLYDRSPAELGLEPGAAVPAEGGDLERAGPVPAPGDLQVREVSGDDAGRWTRAAAPGPALAELRSTAFPIAPEACARFEAETFALDTAEPVATQLALGDGSALVITGRSRGRAHLSPPPETRIYRVRPGKLERVDPDIPSYAETIGRERIDAALLDASGTIWLSTGAWDDRTRPRLWRGSLSAGFVSAASARVREPIDRMIAPADTSTGAIYLRTDRGRVQVFNTAAPSWRDVAAPLGDGARVCLTLAIAEPRIGDAVVRCGTLSWLDDGDLLAADPGGGVYSRIPLDDPAAAITLPVPGGSRATTAAATSIGVVAAVAGNALSDFYVLGRAEWSPLALSVSTQAVHSIAPFRDGFVFSGTSGFLTQYTASRAGSPFCPSHDGIGAGLTVFAITPIGGDQMLLSGWAGASQNVVVLVRAR